MNLDNAPLGKNTAYVSQYQPGLLFPIARQSKRDELGILAADALPFEGSDVWQSYEISWLNQSGKPIVRVARFIVPCQSKCLIESKSFKLYLNSFNQSQFESEQQVKNLIQQDLSQAAGATVEVIFLSEQEVVQQGVTAWSAHCIDSLNIQTECYHVCSDLLALASNAQPVSESLCSHLLKSNCPVTGQPDWGSVLVVYEGKQIDHASLLKYLISFRCHDEFHEQCVERIYIDIMRQCQPEKLTVYACYTRRGGLDINPIRSSVPFDIKPWLGRLFRQ